MDCAEIRQGFEAGGVPSGPPVVAHLKWCPHCSELFRDSAALGRRLALVATLSRQRSSEQLEATESLLERERGVRAFLRSRSTRVRWALSLSIPALVLLREGLRQRFPWRAFSTPRLFGGLLLVGLLGFVTHSALRPLPVERRAARLRSTLALVAWCLPCLLWFAPETQASSEDISGGFALRSLTCFAYGSALAAPSFALSWALDRGIRVPFRVWALAAGVVALLANVILMLHCSDTGRAHLLAGHFSIGLVWFIAASAAAWRTLRVH